MPANPTPVPLLHPTNITDNQFNHTYIRTDLFYEKIDLNNDESNHYFATAVRDGEIKVFFYYLYTL
jgi:hypothetical protein